MTHEILASRLKNGCLHVIARRTEQEVSSGFREGGLKTISLRQTYYYVLIEKLEFTRPFVASITVFRRIPQVDARDSLALMGVDPVVAKINSSGQVSILDAKRDEWRSLRGDWEELATTLKSEHIQDHSFTRVLGARLFAVDPQALTVAKNDLPEKRMVSLALSGSGGYWVSNAEEVEAGEAVSQPGGVTSDVVRIIGKEKDEEVRVPANSILRDAEKLDGRLYLVLAAGDATTVMDAPSGATWSNRQPDYDYLAWSSRDSEIAFEVSDFSHPGELPKKIALWNYGQQKEAVGDVRWPMELTNQMVDHRQ